jgi:hypothetical protein
MLASAGASGSTKVVVKVVDGGGLAATREFDATVPQIEPFAAWKNIHFTPAQQADPAISGDDADPDQDGASNRQEFLAGTDPLDGQSVLKAGVHTAPVVTWLSVPNLTYRVFRSPSLTAPNWVALLPVVIATNATTSYVDLEAVGQAYYRVEVVP